MNSSLFAERLKEARNDIGLSQAAIAKECGISRETWSRYESGKLTPGMEVLAALAAKGADINYILTGIRAIPQTPQALSPREVALLDNYQHTDDYGKGIIEATAFAAAEQKQVKKKA